VSAARLILIEGMIGAGKTTTSGLVETWLRSRGGDARAYQELARDHPVRTRVADQLREHYRQLADPRARPPATARPARMPMRPGSGAASPSIAGQGQRTVILDSTFLQNSVMPAFIDGAPAQTVREIFTTIEREAAAAEPFLIYLRPADTALAIARVHRERGKHGPRRTQPG
jgi:hypothetical protein